MHYLIFFVLLIGPSWLIAHGPDGQRCASCALQTLCGKTSASIATSSRLNSHIPAGWPVELDSVYPSVSGMNLVFLDAQSGKPEWTTPILEGGRNWDGRMERLGDGRVALNVYDENNGRFLGARIYDGKRKVVAKSAIYLPDRRSITWTIEDLALGTALAAENPVKSTP